MKFAVHGVKTRGKPPNFIVSIEFFNVLTLVVFHLFKLFIQMQDRIDHMAIEKEQ
ncbi:Uncharacterised protein [Vibrio cholerae]|nr:Uncharacterised protein [Vibrio cholerae]